MRKPIEMIPRQTALIWRERDDEVIASIPGMTLDATDLTGGPTLAAHRLFKAGARRVRLSEPVDVRSPLAVSSLLLVRELTRFGVVVDWELILDPLTHDWRELSHLYPPRTLTGDPDGPDSPDSPVTLTRWRAGFFPGKFIVRKGLGFVQVRDRRWSGLRVATLTEPAQVQMVLMLLTDSLAAEPITDVMTGLEELRLIQRIGDRLWMPAHRVWRWPAPVECV
jgi:uncharacterized protein DUF5825